MNSKKKRKAKPQETHELCHTCVSMTSTLQGLQAMTSRDGYKHLSKKNIITSAKRGCLLCKILRSYRGNAIYDGHFRVFAELENLTTDDSSKVKHPLRSSRIKRLLVNNPPGGVSFGHELCAFTTVDNPAVKFLPAQPLSIPVMNRTIIEKIKIRLVECQNKHQCCPSNDPPILPKRVVDVGAGSLNSFLTLHISEPNEKALYVALSYCWGGPQEVTTKLANLAEYRSSLPTELPRTIQDAIQVTRSLGFRYLWVDALCILQDDNSDKAAEIYGMGLVYKNAALTIAAASACSANEGFLEDRPPLPMCRLPFFISDDSYGSIWLRSPDQEHTKEPLDSRAWTLQESLLSPRILYYATKDLIWKCQKDEFVVVNETHNPYFKSTIGRLPSGIFSRSQTASSHFSQVKTWRKVIEDYSGRSISVPEDRVPALTGLVRELQTLWKDNYIAGMWQSCLVKHLGWVQYGDNPKRPITAYKSPGWSWLSCEGRVWVSEVYHEEAQVLDVAVALVDKNLPFGQFRSGRLVLRAPVLPGNVRTRLGSLSMNFSLTEGSHSIECCKFLLLGYSRQMIPVGIILLRAEDGSFMRIGHHIGWHLGATAPWSSDLVKQEVITVF